jgi:hypothetical protein
VYSRIAAPANRTSLKYERDPLATDSSSARICCSVVELCAVRVAADVLTGVPVVERPPFLTAARLGTT